MRALIVDDEELARITLRELLKEFCPSIKVTAEAANVLQAVDIIKKQSPELVFLDIEMPNISGLKLPSFFEGEELDFQIIFTTAYSQYAIEAFRLSAVDYLLKPIGIDQLQEATQKAKQHRQVNSKSVIALQENLNQQLIKRLVVPTADGLEFLTVEAIRFLVAEGSYTNIHLHSGRRIVVSKNLKTFQKLENYSHFFKSHRSYIINVNSIQRFSQINSMIILDNGKEVPLSKRRKSAFFDLVRTLNFST